MRENLLSFINLYCTVSGNFKGNVFPNVFPKLLNNHNHRKKWSFSERLVTLLYWFFVSFFFVLQFEFYHSIQRFWSSSIYCDRHARAGKRASATPRDENHRAPSRFGCTPVVIDPYCPWIEKGVPDALRSFFSARNRIEDRNTQEITSTSEHVLRFAILLRG